MCFKYISSFRNLIALLICVLLVLIRPVIVIAATTNTQPAARISFTFDDGLTSAITQAAPTLAKYGIPATNYIITNCVGMDIAPNTCRADSDATYMTWAQVAQLQSTYGWEIGSHSASHPYLATSDPDDQPIPITFAQTQAELSQSKAALLAHGINAVSFAPPYGDYNMQTLAEIAKHYGSMRGFQDTGYNSWPYNEYLIRDQHIEGNVGVATVKKYIDTAIANKQWLVLTFHDIKTKVSRQAYDYQYSTANLNLIAAYVKSKQDAGLIKATTVRDSFVNSDTNLLANPSFDNGIAEGWVTDTPGIVTADGLNNGSYPNSAHSIKLTAGASAARLNSPAVRVDSSTTYLIKIYSYVQRIFSGELGFYIDEYDINGSWISGQWKSAERTVFAENINFTYKPTSAAVVTSRLQVSATANSGIVAYVDNVQWSPLSTSITPSPVVTNLVANGTFDNGITDGWTTDNTLHVIADVSGSGSPTDAQNSVKMTAVSKNIHLFSPKVPVMSSEVYTISTYVKITQRASGELGFYIDEYDVNGSWISGQWKSARTAVSAGDSIISYKPSSTSVASASLQIYLLANSGIIAYVDNIRWHVE